METPIDYVAMNAITDTVMRAYTANLMDNLFSMGLVERDPNAHLGPMHGPYRSAPDWRTRKGKIVTYYKRREWGSEGGYVHRGDYD